VTACKPSTSANLAISHAPHSTESTSSILSGWQR
jgi:hypothetical protein